MTAGVRRNDPWFFFFLRVDIFRATSKKPPTDFGPRRRSRRLRGQNSDFCRFGRRAAPSACCERRRREHCGPSAAGAGAKKCKKLISRRPISDQTVTPAAPNHKIDLFDRWTYKIEVLVYKSAQHFSHAVSFPKS